MDRGSPTNSKPHTIFLSYSRDDRAKAQAIVAALEAHGLSVWWDGLIEGGHDFADKIEDALTSADCVVVLWSPTSIHSHWVRDEAATARDRGCMVPVTIAAAQSPLGFRQFQNIDLTHWRGRRSAPEIEQLCHSIESTCGNTHHHFRQPTIDRLAAFSRRKMIFGAATGAAVLVTGIGGFELFRKAPAGDTSIGVLPFRNLSGDPADDHLADGITEELRATLSQNGSLSVAAETSTDLAGKKSSKLWEVASALGVKFLVGGSVELAADMVRIAAHIVDGSTGFDKWSQTFDRKLTDILALQSEIAAFVTDALLSSLDASKAPRDRIGGTHSNAAFDAYLRGMALYKLAAGEQSDYAALHQFQRAVAIDPNYAVAQAALSRNFTVIANSYDLHGHGRVFRRSAEDAARRAIRVAPRLADGYSALGFALLNGELDTRGAAAAYQRSFELGYGSADTLIGYANMAMSIGRFSDARLAIARAQKLDPLNATVYRSAGRLEFDARNYDAAASAFHSALALNPKANYVHMGLGDIELMTGDAASAREQYLQEPDPVDRLRGLAIANRKLSRGKDAEAALAELTSKYGDFAYYERAQVMAQWGRTDEALTFLEEAVATGDNGVVRSNLDPLLDPIKKTARFTAVERRLGFA